jgi:small subunit ribosomal protein S4
MKLIGRYDYLGIDSWVRKRFSELHKKRRGGAASEYKKSLQEKQALKKWYGLGEKQFKRYVKEALSKMGKVNDVSAELVKRLETRLDNVVYRLGFAESRSSARQLVVHGHFLVNGKPVNIPSFIFKKGDVVSFKESKKKKPLFKNITELIKKKQPPVWLHFNKDKFEGKSIGEPTLLEVNLPVEISLIFEFYSR